MQGSSAPDTEAKSSPWSRGIQLAGLRKLVGGGEVAILPSLPCCQIIITCVTRLGTWCSPSDWIVPRPLPHGYIRPWMLCPTLKPDRDWARLLLHGWIVLPPAPVWPSWVQMCHLPCHSMQSSWPWPHLPNTLNQVPAMLDQAYQLDLAPYRLGTAHPAHGAQRLGTIVLGRSRLRSRAGKII